jgi:hypothetical protein
MRSRVAMATAVSRGLCAVAGVLALVGAQVLVGTGTADAATRTGSAMVVRDSMDVGVAGTVGVVAVLVGAVGLVFGLTRRHRQTVARRAEERGPS